MNRKIPSRLGLSLGSALVVALLAGCAGEAPVGPEGQGGSGATTVAGGETASRRSSDLGSCDSLRAPSGSRFVARLYARGFQIYHWDGAAWVFVEPSARLFAGRHGKGQIGIHYAGPTWESLGGSKVVGSIMRRCTPNANAIPWLLLSAVSSEGHGIFRGVKFIQRLGTVGGLAPAQPGTVVGELSNVPYTADYVFYRTR